MPLEFVEKSNENKRRAALSHICDLCLSLLFVDSISVDDIVKVVFECERDAEGE